jgi:hypothetical protein
MCNSGAVCSVRIAAAHDAVATCNGASCRFVLENLASGGGPDPTPSVMCTAGAECHVDLRGPSADQGRDVQCLSSGCVIDADGDVEPDLLCNSTATCILRGAPDDLVFTCDNGSICDFVGALSAAEPAEFDADNGGDLLASISAGVADLEATNGGDLTVIARGTAEVGVGCPVGAGQCQIDCGETATCEMNCDDAGVEPCAAGTLCSCH